MFWEFSTSSNIIAYLKVLNITQSERWMDQWKELVLNVRVEFGCSFLDAEIGQDTKYFSASVYVKMRKNDICWHSIDAKWKPKKVFQMLSKL